MKHPGYLLHLCVGLALCAVAASAQPAAVTAKPTVPERGDARHTVRALVQAIGRADPVDNVYLNRARAEGIGSLLSRPMSDERRLQLQVQVGTEWVRAGQTRRGIALLAAALAKLDSGAIEAPTSYRTMLHHRLGIAWMRLGEQENCLLNHSTDSCLLPIGGDGVHQLPEGSRRALAHFRQILAAQPEDLGTRWLLNIAHMTLGSYPDGVPERWRIPPEAFAGADFPRFRDVATAAGVATVTPSGGCAVEDFDGDGRLDIMASSWALRDPLRLFRNRGDGTFEERSVEAGLTGQIGGLNLEHADVDNDGDVDILVLRGAWMGEQGRMANSLLRNEGDGTFTDITLRAGLFTEHPTQTGAFGDFDNDGWLDLYIGNESGAQPHPCQLFRNRGDGTFVDVAAEAGVDHVGYVKGVAWGDADNDGRLDLYVSQIGQDNVLYRNLGEQRRPDGSVAWRFAAGARAPGPQVSFPTWFWDMDNDGWLDLFAGGYDLEDLGDMPRAYLGEPFAASHAHVYRNAGDGSFRDVTADMGGMDRVVLAMGANYGDLDSDGFPDAYIGTGIPDLRALTPNRMLRNDGGRRFVDVTTAGGFGNVQKGHAVAFADFDNDGDQDVFTVMGGAFEGDIYQNVLYENPGGGGHWLRLFPEGVRANRGAVGGRVRLRLRAADGGTRDVYHLIGSGGSFGASPLAPHIGLGDAVAIDEVQLTWPGSGLTQRWTGLEMDRAYRLREDDPTPVAVDLPRFRLGGATLPAGHDAGHSGAHGGH